MLVVTGGDGFIGSALVHAFASDGHDVVVVDAPADPAKAGNLAGTAVADRWSPEELLHALDADSSAGGIDAVVHQGAISSTLHHDAEEVMRVNYGYSAALLERCLTRRVPLLYASSAAVYGRSDRFVEAPRHEAPLNVYGRSKQRFDDLVRARLAEARSQLVGLRYFNVYGPREAHKGSMASMIHQLDRELAEHGVATLFGASHGCAPGEHRRDFVHVDDVVAVLRWFLVHPDRSGVFNVGTGRSHTFNAVVDELLAWHPGGRRRFVEMPERIARAYQPHTCADLTGLRQAGYDGEMTNLRDGIARFMTARSSPAELVR